MMTKIALVLLASFLIAPVAVAHNTVQTDDGEYFLTVGHRNEPTATFLRSGLDLIIRENNNGERGDEVAGLADKLTATVISPSGEELSHPLHTQHGAVGRYSFGDPYVLTEPGQYKLRLSGMIGDTVVDGTYDISGPLDKYGDLTFPRTDVPTPLELQERIASLEARIVELEAHEREHSNGYTNGPGLILVLGTIVGLAMARRQF